MNFFARMPDKHSAWECFICGALVSSRSIHQKWHKVSAEDEAA